MAVPGLAGAEDKDSDREGGAERTRTDDPAAEFGRMEMSGRVLTASDGVSNNC